MMHSMVKETSSPEFEIDRTVEDLIGKLIAGTITPKEQAEYERLVAHRSRMMRSAVTGRFRREGSRRALA